MTFTRKPVFWILHFLFFIACVLYAWKNFNRAFPFVDIQIKMDRKTALEKAAQLASDHGLFPKQGYLKAVTFQIDSPTQNFIELEAGGPRSLKSILKEGVYTPYTWQVRHFAQGQTNESRLSFTPDGTLYGLWEKISEDDPGAALDAAQARKLAESSAQGSWAVDLKPYHLVEQASQTRKSGRVDHSFIYERGQVGDGKYRLKLSLSGNRLSEISRFIQVPDAFFRRFEAMRSANSTVSSLAGAVIVLLYGLGFCGFGLFTLARRHAVLWRRPAALAAFISLLQFLDHLNRLPLEWMDYDTAISTQAFVVRLVTNWLLEAIFDFIIVVIPLLAGESLSRLAFADHPQLWRVFTGDAAGSRQIFGRILGAYLLVGLNFAWAAWIYIVGSQRLGWWNPSELLFHPDELATYFPWLTSIANSLHAGIWEECLFRAVPLAGAALLGNRFGRRAAWIAGAFILQMLVFGAAHADYPAQPSYARLVELLVPSSLFGGMYLLFGLLPAMLM
ncbi:MAG: CPBP family intramembrane metalloprotease, partial [Deltaproteobacteria bacterium]|nr:CPBP family intramembrane metalloprotease [Deltaproteobacteria bacterium]